MASPDKKLQAVARRVVLLAGDYDGADEGIEDEVVESVSKIIGDFVRNQRPRLPEKIPESLEKLLYDECGGYVDCDLDPTKVWAAFRKYVKEIKK